MLQLVSLGKAHIEADPQRRFRAGGHGLLDGQRQLTGLQRRNRAAVIRTGAVAEDDLLAGRQAQRLGVGCLLPFQRHQIADQGGRRHKETRHSHPSEPKKQMWTIAPSCRKAIVSCIISEKQSGCN